MKMEVNLVPRREIFTPIWLLLMSYGVRSVYSMEGKLLVNRTLVRGAKATGAVCLDGSLPAYHLHRGFGSGAFNWLLQFEGGGWCNDINSCLERAKTRRGSTRYMNKFEIFSGILSNNASLNPDFYNWNRVKIRYCDGASFAGDSMFHNGTTSLYFRGQRIWNAIIHDLLQKGLNLAHKALLSGCSAGGLATFLHCDDFKSLLPENASVKCLSDAGFFLNLRDLSGNHTMRSFFESVVSLQGVVRNLDKNCISSQYYPTQCFFPQYALPYITTPYFILNSAYDVYQFHHSLVPFSADQHGHWRNCELDPAACTPNQISILQGLRNEMLSALRLFRYSRVGGMFINSCFAHCQSELQEAWFAPNSPRVNNKGQAPARFLENFLNFHVPGRFLFMRDGPSKEKLLVPLLALKLEMTLSKTIAETVGDWYFRGMAPKEIDCPYPCNKSCQNLIP